MASPAHSANPRVTGGTQSSGAAGAVRPTEGTPGSGRHDGVRRLALSLREKKKTKKTKKQSKTDKAYRITFCYF